MPFNITKIPHPKNTRNIVMLLSVSKKQVYDQPEIISEIF